MENEMTGIAHLEDGVSISPKIRKFIRVYDGDIVSSMVNAGFTGKPATLASRGKVILAMPAVQEAIKELATIQASERSLIAKKDEVLAFFTDTMRNEDPNFKRTVKDGIIVETENISMTNRMKAAELLGKASNLFVENVNITGTLGVMDIIRKTYEEDDSDLEAIEAEYERVRESKQAFIEAPTSENPFNVAKAEDLI